MGRTNIQSGGKTIKYVLLSRFLWYLKAAPDERVNYKVRITTADLLFGGTDDDVYIDIKGSRGRRQGCNTTALFSMTHAYCDIICDSYFANDMTL